MGWDLVLAARTIESLLFAGPDIKRSYLNQIARKIPQPPIPIADCDQCNAIESALTFIGLNQTRVMLIPLHSLYHSLYNSVIHFLSIRFININFVHYI